MVLLGGGKGGKIFWGLPYRFSTNPERIVKLREIAPSKIGLLCIGSRTWEALLLAPIQAAKERLDLSKLTPRSEDYLSWTQAGKAIIAPG